jgi:hypothetical protein
MVAPPELFHRIFAIINYLTFKKDMTFIPTNFNYFHATLVGWFVSSLIEIGVSSEEDFSRFCFQYKHM